MAFESFYELNVTRSSYAIPTGALGCWVTLLGAGGAGGRGWAAGAAARGGGGGAGGGGFVPRFWIPASSFGGATTYSTAIGAAGTVGVIGGTAQSDGGDTVFTLGSIVITAGGGKKGGDGATNAVGTGGAGGTCSFSGITAGTSYSGGAGGNGGNYTGNAAGAAGSSGSNGSGGGGGGGGGLDAGGTSPSYTTSSGGAGGNGFYLGATQAAANATVPNTGQAGLLLHAGGAGSGGPMAPGYTAVVGGDGALGSGGGGSTGTNGTRRLGGAGGAGAALVEWMVPAATGVDIPREYVAMGDANPYSTYSLGWTHSTDGGTDSLVLISITLNTNTATNLDAINTTPTVTYGGNAANFIARSDVGDTAQGAMFMFAVFAPSSGDAAIAVSWSTSGTAYVAQGSSVSYQGVAGIGETRGRQRAAQTSHTLTLQTGTGRRAVMMSSHQGTYTGGTFSDNILTQLTTSGRAFLLGDAYTSGSTETFTWTTASAVCGYIGIDLYSTVEAAVGGLAAFLRSHHLTGGRATGNSATLSTSWSHNIDASGANTVAVVILGFSINANSPDNSPTVTWGGTAMTQIDVKYQGSSSADRSGIAMYGLFNPPTGNSSVVATGVGTANLSAIAGTSSVYASANQVTAWSPYTALGVSVTNQVGQNAQVIGFFTNAVAETYSDYGDTVPSGATTYYGGSSVSGVGDYMRSLAGVSAVGATVSRGVGGTSSSPLGALLYITGRTYDYGPMAAALQKATAAMTGESRVEGPLALSMQRLVASLTGQQVQTGTMPVTLKYLTFAGQGTPSQTGTVIAAIPMATMSATGTPTQTGTMAPVLKYATMASTGAQSQTGPLAAALLPAVAALGGATGASSVSGTAGMVMLPATFTGRADPIIAAVLKYATMAATGAQTYTGSSGMVMKYATMAATGIETYTGTGGMVMRYATMASSGTPVTTGTLAAAFILAPLFRGYPPTTLAVVLRPALFGGEYEPPVPEGGDQVAILIPRGALFRRVVSEIQHVVLHTYDGIQVAQFTSERQLSLRWNRALREVSTLDLTVPTTSGYDIPTVTPWMHWASVWDEHVNTCYWTGPVLRAARTHTSLTLKAADIAAYLKRTRCPVDRAWEARNPATIAAELWEMMAEARQFNTRPVVLRDPRGHVFDFTATRDAEALDQTFNKLVQLGLYWSVVSGQPVFGPAPLEPFRALGEEHFQSDSIALVRDGSNTFNDIVVRASDTISRARKDLGGLQLENIVNLDDVAGVGNADRAAQEYVRQLGGIRDSIEMPSGAVLAPDAPVDIQELIPSVRINVEAFDLLQTFELENVSVALAPGQIPQTAINLEGVNDDLPELVALSMRGGAGVGGGE